MPIPGPRNQFGAVPGYRNPHGTRQLDRFNRNNRPPPVASLGETPGLMYVTRHVRTLAAGTIRRLYRQTVGYTSAQAPYSWTGNGNAQSHMQAVGVTRSLRYMARSVYVGAGIDNTRFAGLHSRVAQTDRIRGQKGIVTLGKGQTRSRPTTRNRMTSFGSRVKPLNPPVQGAQGAQNGDS